MDLKQKLQELIPMEQLGVSEFTLTILTKAIEKKFTEQEIQDILDQITPKKILNYMSDSELEHFLHEVKWTKEQLLPLLRQSRLSTEKEGIYNDNALVAAMNYEYASHMKYINSTGRVILVSHLLAEEALQRKGYIDRIMYRK